MSGPIRHVLALAKTKLKKKLEASATYHPLVRPNASLEENMSKLAEKKTQMRVELELIQRAVDLLERQHGAWTQFIQSLKKGEQEREEKLYENVASSPDNFLEILLEGEDRLALLSAWIRQVDDEKAQLLLSASLATPWLHGQAALLNGPTEIGQSELTNQLVSSTPEINAPKPLTTHVKGWNVSCVYCSYKVKRQCCLTKHINERHADKNPKAVYKEGDKKVKSENE